MTFRIREVDGGEYAGDLEALHEAVFDRMNHAPLPDTLKGHWWLAWQDGEAVAFAGVIPSTVYPEAGYYTRVGVLPICRGAGLQMRLTRAIEARCKRNGWRTVISDTTHDNFPSANNFIRAGYRLFRPDRPWAFANSLYWRKEL